VAAARRVPRPGLLRQSLAAGARVASARLQPAQQEVAVQAAQATGLEVAAVDLLETRGGETQVFGVHASPGLRALEAATGEDLAAPIVRRAVEIAHARRPPGS